MRRCYGPPLGWGIVPDRRDPEAVLITGVFGSGKSCVAVEIADVLEGLDLPHAVLDLDFLTWFHTGATTRRRSIACWPHPRTVGAEERRSHARHAAAGRSSDRRVGGDREAPPLRR